MSKTPFLYRRRGACASNGFRKSFSIKPREQKSQSGLKCRLRCVCASSVHDIEGPAIAGNRHFNGDPSRNQIQRMIGTRAFVKKYVAGGKEGVGLLVQVGVRR